MEALREIATRHGLALIEDACEAIGAEFNGLRVAATGGGDLSVTEAVARRTLALPFFNRITAEQQEQVAEVLNSALCCPSWA